MNKIVDSYRYLRGVSKTLIKNWVKLESPCEIPWTTLARPLSESTVALISTGGIALKTDRPFDQEGERQNPWWGDPSYRIIPRGTRSGDIRVYHMHIDPRHGEQDLNCLLPLDRLEELAASGKVRSAAPSHYSFMGYLLDPRDLLEKSIPLMIQNLRAEAVDAAVFIPA